MFLLKKEVSKILKTSNVKPIFKHLRPSRSCYTVHCKLIDFGFILQRKGSKFYVLSQFLIHCTNLILRSQSSTQKKKIAKMCFACCL